jgi:hypothetical protein
MNRNKSLIFFTSWLLYLLIFGVQLKSYAQYPLPVDSLKRELSKARDVDDSARVLCQIVWRMSNNDVNLIFNLNQKALGLVFHTHCYGLFHA